MNNDLDQDLSYSLESGRLEDSGEASNPHSIQQQQLDLSNRSNAFDKYFPAHENFMPTSKFPFHIYLKQRYKRLSLQQQIRIFQDYFDTLNTDKQLNIEPSHIQILNEGINLFSKVPKNSKLILTFQPYNKTQQILTLKNYNGQIIHFKIQQKNRKRISSLLQIRRRLKDEPFLLIKDSVKSQNCSLSTWLNKKFVSKLADNFKVLYVKLFQGQSELQFLKKQFFGDFDFAKQRLPFIKAENFYITANLTNRQFYVYSGQDIMELNRQSLQKLKQQLIAHLQKLRLEQDKLLNSDTVALKCKFRLKVFDALYINFIKSTGKSKQQFIQIIKKMSIRYAHNLEEVQSDRDHFPERILNSKRCKHCQVIGREKNNKSKYKCLGCSKKFQVDIPLCIQCWGDFHQEIIPICGNVAPRGMRKAYEAHLQRNSQVSLKSPEKFKIKTSSTEEVRNTILKLNQNMTQIQRLMDELQQSDIGAKMVKSFNQVLFLNIIDTFNSIMSKMVQESMQNKNRSNLPNHNTATSQNFAP